jgi:hypothetical protein
MLHSQQCHHRPAEHLPSARLRTSLVITPTGTLNALLARQPQARRRGLCLRTYAVLPLTDDCGILQWVDNLVPFKAACEEVLAKEKLYSRHSTPHQIKKMYDGFVGA